MSNVLSSKISYRSPPREIAGDAGEDVFDYAALQGVEEIHLKRDPVSGLKAIIAIHSTKRGPALGGTRCLFYPNTDHALYDAMRLARGMSYKSAFSGLPFGGGKGVLIRPDHIDDADAYFESYGQFIDNLGGRFITAVDVGTRVEDMDIVSRKTQYVLSTSRGHGDPSMDTAKGVYRGILAAAKARLGRDSVEGLRIAIQGVGKVGRYLVKLLDQQGAKLTVCDIDTAAAQICAAEFGVSLVDADAIYDLDCDIFAPCALGSIINDTTLPRIKARVICGSANNQLASDHHGDLLHGKGIFYVPDYVVNVGGLIHVVLGENEDSRHRISKIYDAVMNVFDRSISFHQSSHRVANRIAEQKFLDPKQEEK